MSHTAQLQYQAFEFTVIRNGYVNTDDLDKEGRPRPWINNLGQLARDLVKFGSLTFSVRVAGVNNLERSNFTDFQDAYDRAFELAQTYDCDDIFINVYARSFVERANVRANLSALVAELSQQQ